MADQPVNFLSALGVLPDPTTSFLTGVQHAEDRQYLNTMRQAEIDQVRAKVEASRAAKAQRAQWAAAAQAAMDNPTAQNFARLHLINPEASTAIKEAWGSLDKQRQASDLQEMSAIRGLLAAGRPELARERLQARIEADRAAGQDTADDEEVLALIDRDPSAARFMVDYALSSIAGPEKFGQMLGELGGEARAQELHPSAVRKAQADATKAAVDAEYADDMAQLGMANTRSEMGARELQAQIAAGNLDVARQRLALDREKAEAAAAKGKEPTEAQAKDAFNAKRMARATTIISNLEPDNFFGRVGKALSPAQAKRYEAAQTEWVDAMLRLTSGAEAPEGEVKRQIETYFPTGVDGEEVIRQKAEMRRQIMRDAIVRAGDAAAGLVMDGYRFKGGDPAQKSSWEKVR